MNSDKFQHIDDNGLLQKFYADKNNEWLGILMQRYTMMLLGVCMKYLKNEEEARDSVQQVFLKAITELQKYKVDYFKSWIYMIAKNYCLMKLRDKNKYQVSINEETIVSTDEATDIKKHVDKDLELNNLEAALKLLNSEQQRCVTLFYLHKKTYNEITKETGYSLLQVKSYIQNGKRNLRILMDRVKPNEE